MNKIGFLGALLLLVSTTSSAIPPSTVNITARFTPNVVASNQTTTFLWSASSGATCDVDGLPGGWRTGPSGSYTFPATESLTVWVSCDNGVDFNSKAATLTVSNAAPTVTSSFSPSTVYVGGGASTFSWNSTMATSCSSPQHSGVADTSGSVAVAPASSPSQQTITVNCVGANGSASSSSSLNTIVQPPPPPSVVAYAIPAYLNGPGTTTISYSAINATSCSGWGTYYVTSTSFFTVTCWGPGGYGSSLTSVYVAPSLYGAAGNVGRASAMTSQGTKPAVKRTPPSLAHLGIDLAKLRYEYTEGDFNHDGAVDLIVFDKTKSQAYLLLSKAGQYPSITKTIPNVATFSQIKGIFVPASGAVGEIRVSVESQQ
jgi:hypothetical protein